MGILYFPVIWELFHKPLYKDPYQTTSILESKAVFFSWLIHMSFYPCVFSIENLKICSRTKCSCSSFFQACLAVLACKILTYLYIYIYTYIYIYILYVCTIVKVDDAIRQLPKGEVKIRGHDKARRMGVAPFTFQVVYLELSLSLVYCDCKYLFLNL